MRSATLTGLALAAAFGVAMSGAAVLARGAGTPPAVQPAPAGSAQPAPAAAAPNTPASTTSAPPSSPPAASVGRGGGSPAVRSAEKRRRTYASCNRESHNRGLRGGARRRFLIRCKLGYDRRRPGSPSAPALAPSPPSAKRP